MTLDHNTPALALSGGGFRATLFHCGALLRLNELGYLTKISRISSVSGGSIASGMLAVSDGNEIYWEASGNPNGKPALTLHGGPGSGLGEGYRRRFDPEKFLIIGLDQRGCGRSRPLVIDPDAPALETNNRRAIIADIEALRSRESYRRTGGRLMKLTIAPIHASWVSSS